MKIRIKANSVRYRLTKTEVAMLCRTGYIQDETTFGENKFIYAVKVVDKVKQLKASFENNTITLTVPQDLVRNWENDDRVGFENQQLLDQENTLHLLIEKDFTCLDNTMEDQSDNYPNPKLQESNN